MVAIAQLVEHLIVVQKVARSSRVSHPTEDPHSRRVFLFLSARPRQTAPMVSRSIESVDGTGRKRDGVRPGSSGRSTVRPAKGAVRVPVRRRCRWIGTQRDTAGAIVKTHRGCLHN